MVAGWILSVIGALMILNGIFRSKRKWTWGVAGGWILLIGLALLVLTSHASPRSSAGAAPALAALLHTGPLPTHPA